jgi:hypothetical protein
MRKVRCCLRCGTQISKAAILCKACYFITLKGKGNPFFGKHHTKKVKSLLSLKHSNRKIYCCRDCGAEISYNTAFYSNGRCRKCNGIYQSQQRKSKIFIGVANPMYIDGRTLKEYFCIDCGKRLSIWYAQRCKSCANKGANNPNWIDGRKGHPYNKYIFNEELKLKIRKRDNFECQNCHVSDKEHLTRFETHLHIHHIDYNKENCDEKNLITTCLQCNSKANYNRDYWYAYYTYIMENR